MENVDIREIEKTKRFLKRYKKNKYCLARLVEKYKRLDERITSIKSPSLSGMPRGGVPITVDELISDKIELEERIKRLKSKGKKYKREILDAIDSLDDPRYCEILEAFCIECLTLEDIAERECYTVRHTYRLYKQAVLSIAETRQ